MSHWRIIDATFSYVILLTKDATEPADDIASFEHADHKIGIRCVSSILLLESSIIDKSDLVIARFFPWVASLAIDAENVASYIDTTLNWSV